LSKIGKVSPEKDNSWTGQELDQCFFFLIFEILVKFNKIKISKIRPIYTTKPNFSKNFPISLSKIGEISPEKKNTRQDRSQASVFFLFF